MVSKRQLLKSDPPYPSPVGTPRQGAPAADGAALVNQIAIASIGFAAWFARCGIDRNVSPCYPDPIEAPADPGSE